jgi:hypothetical protein
MAGAVRNPYSIVRTAARADLDLDVVIVGPGLSPDGSRFVLSTIERARTLVNALNLAYEHGVQAGAEQQAKAGANANVL